MEESGIESRGHDSISESILTFDRNLAFSFGTLFLAFSVVILWVGMNVYRGITEKNEDELNSTITGIVADAVNRVSFSGKYHSRLLIEDIVASEPRVAYILIVDPDLNVVAHSDPELNDTVLHGPEVPFAEKVLEGEPNGSLDSTYRGESVRVSCLPHFSGYEEKKSGVILVAITTEELNRRMAIARVWMGLLLALVTFAALVGTYYLSRRFGRNLRRLAGQLQGILEYSPLLIAIGDREAGVIAMSRNLRMKGEGNVLSMLERGIGHVFKTGRSSAEEVSQAVDGKERTFLTIGFPIQISGGNPSDLACSIALDLTERKEAENALEVYRSQLESLVEERTHQLESTQSELLRSEKLAALGKLTATVSHELRNPLGTIRGSIYTIGELAGDGDEKLERAIARAERNVRRCDRIIEELLNYTRETPLDLEPHDLDRWIGTAVSDIEIPDGVQIKLDLTSGRKHRFDSENIHRVLVNLIKNASEAVLENTDKIAGHQPSIIVHTRNLNDRTEIQIEDNGPGISKENLNQVFEPLFSTKGFGIGLGLSIVRQILQRHDGDIRFESELGKGTNAVFWLPFDPETEYSSL